MKEEIVFQSIGNDDYQCKKGRYMLHVEKMDKKLWLWSVTDLKEMGSHSDYPIKCRSKKEAVLACVEKYLNISRL